MQNIKNHKKNNKFPGQTISNSTRQRICVVQHKQYLCNIMTSAAVMIPHTITDASYSNYLNL